MSEESAWNTARLIPTSGINGVEEQERRATSALLAVMSSVREFGRTLTGPLGAPAAHLETFIEVPFLLGEKKVFPDGLIRARRGSKTWIALVEVKTGANALAAEQLENYLDVAREHEFDALITISNEIAPATGVHPTAVDRRKLRKVALHHWSWSEVVTQAVMQKEYRGVADPDQAWILGELIRYLEHPRSGALSFDDMGANWVAVREAVTAGTLRANDKAASDVASRFDALIRFACLQLGRRLGAEVTPVLSRQEMNDPNLRNSRLVSSLVGEGCLRAVIRIPNAVSPLTVEADLRASRITCSLDIDAPREGRPTTRVNWLIRQLKDAPESVRVEAFAARMRTGAAELLKTVREDPAKLVADPTKEIRAFRVAQSHPLGSKRGVGRGAFIDSMLAAIDGTYGDLGQRLKAWSAAPPRLRSPEEVEVDTDLPIDVPSAALSSQDEDLAPHAH
ncbi:MAG: stress response protein [Naasia sp.]|nr:stress response protein [Naasia sp.]